MRKLKKTVSFVDFFFKAKFKTRLKKLLAPSAPRNLTYSEITNSSVLLNWLEPETINGEIRHHRIEFFSNVNSTQEKQEKHIKDVEINSTSYVLDGLKSFTRYAIYIFACTVKCSKESSNIINFQTKIGGTIDTIKQ